MSSVAKITNLVLGSICGLSMAFGTGANDAANSVGPSVGAGAMTIKQALILGAIFEAIGGIVIGRYVSATLRKGVVYLDAFTSRPLDFSNGMLSALFGASVWLFIATYFSLPVSTTHAIVGGIVGFALLARGVSALNLPSLGNIALSWVISPLSGFVVAYLVFKFCQFTILGRKHPREAAFKWAPFHVFLTVWIMAVFSIESGLKSLKLDLPLWLTVLIGIAVGTIGYVVTAWKIVPIYRAREERRQKRIELKEIQQKKDEDRKQKHMDEIEKRDDELDETFVSEEVVDDVGDFDDTQSVASSTYMSEVGSEVEFFPASARPGFVSRFALPYGHDEAEVSGMKRSPSDATDISMTMEVEYAGTGISDSDAANTTDVETDTDSTFDGRLRDDSDVFKRKSEGESDRKESSVVTAVESAVDDVVETSEKEDTTESNAEEKVGRKYRTTYYSSSKTKKKSRKDKKAKTVDVGVQARGKSVLGRIKHNYAERKKAKEIQKEEEKSEEKIAKEKAKLEFEEEVRKLGAKAAVPLFFFLQNLAAAFVALGHGANNVPNSTGPFAAILAVFSTDTVGKSYELSVWIFVIASVALDAGLLLFGTRVLLTIGEKVTLLTPVGGYVAQLSTSLTTVVCSRLGMPISTTHILIGAVMGVGVARSGKGSLNLKVIMRIVVSWLITLPVSGITAISLYAVLDAIFV